jgi:hypothetical protein
MDMFDYILEQWILGSITEEIGFGIVEHILNILYLIEEQWNT